MNSTQQVLITLLDEIDKICQKEKINYVLCKETALGAVKMGALFENACTLNIAMTPADAKSFIKAAKKQKREDRVLDYMGNNRNYPSFTVSYGAKNTTLVKLPYNGKGVKPCIKVTINMLMGKPSLPMALYTYSKKFWDIATTPSGTVREIVKRVINVGCHCVKFVLGGALLGRIFFNIWAAMFKNKSAKFALGNTKFIYPKELNKNYSKAFLCSKTYPVFGNTDLYFTLLYGDEYMNFTPDYMQEGGRVLSLTELPFNEYEAALKNELKGSNLSLKKFVYEFRQALVAVYNKKIGKYYAVVDRTQKRFAMWEMYMPQKELILSLGKEKKYEELNELLKPYRSALWSCYKKGLGLCFDKEIFKTTMDMLTALGEGSYAKKLTALVPESHWEPLEVVNYKGERI